jgi:hypothetical protein
VGNVLRGVAVQEWNEPILGALMGAVLGMALHFLTSLNISRHLPKQAGPSGLRRSARLRHYRSADHQCPGLRDRLHALHTGLDREPDHAFHPSIRNPRKLLPPQEPGRD